MRGGGDSGIVITDNSEFTFMDVCKPDSPVNIRVADGAKPAINALPPREGLTMSESSGSALASGDKLCVVAEDGITYNVYTITAAPQPGAQPPAPTAAELSGGFSLPASIYDFSRRSLPSQARKQTRRTSMPMNIASATARPAPGPRSRQPLCSSLSMTRGIRYSSA